MRILGSVVAPMTALVADAILDCSRRGDLVLDAFLGSGTTLIAAERTGRTGTVTLPNRARNKSAGMLGSRRSDDVAPRLHRRGPEGSVRFCGREMALDVESVVSGCVG